MIGNVVISEVNVFRYVILIKAEKYMPYKEFDVTREMCDIIAGASH